TRAGVAVLLVGARFFVPRRSSFLIRPSWALVVVHGEGRSCLGSDRGRRTRAGTAAGELPERYARPRHSPPMPGRTGHTR
ncbi:unnamed protein product, partial [Ectocarpus fasciculatus]